MDQVGHGNLTHLVYPIGYYQFVAIKDRTRERLTYRGTVWISPAALCLTLG